jgi:glycosyltransferase involved in cell wall biosynthesis
MFETDERQPAISIVIITRNEERNLPGCLKSVGWCDDVIVIDSFSSDATVRLATDAGARVVQRSFKDFADQRNFAHEARLPRHPWVFHLDADEHFTPELRAECLAVAAKDNPAVDGYYTAPRMMFMGRWVKRCTDWPAWQARLAHRERFRFVQVGHGQRESPSMRMGRLESGYLHLISSGTPGEWTAKHARYAREEAREIRANPVPLGTLLRRAFGADTVTLERRRALKRLWFYLPARPLLRFIYQYVVRGGVLDGYAGYCYCRLISHYEWLIGRALAEEKEH